MRTVVWHQKTAGSQRSDPGQDRLRVPPGHLLTPQEESL